MLLNAKLSFKESYENGRSCENGEQMDANKTKNKMFTILFKLRIDLFERAEASMFLPLN